MPCLRYIILNSIKYRYFAFKGWQDFLRFQIADKNDLIKFSPLRDVGYIDHTNLLKQSASNYNQSVSPLINKIYVQDSFKDDLGCGGGECMGVMSGGFGIWGNSVKITCRRYN